MSTPLNELRAYRTTTRQLLDEGMDPFSVALAVDSRLVEVANHVAICHRVIAEARATLRHSFFPDRGKLQASIDQAAAVLEEMEALQSELIDVKGLSLRMIRDEINSLRRSLTNLQEAS